MMDKKFTYTYLITDGEFIKCGATSRSTTARMKDLQIGNARKLTELCSTELISEANLHYTLIRCGFKHKQGEWFYNDEDIDQVVKVITDLNRINRCEQELKAWKSELLTMACFNNDQTEKLGKIFSKLWLELKNKQIQLKNYLYRGLQ